MVNAAEGFEFSEDELILLEDINTIRLNIGLDEFEPEPLIGSLARLHSENMAVGDIDLGHDGLDVFRQPVRTRAGTRLGAGVHSRGACQSD